MTNSFDIAALIGSRICHDLISPVGAIGNGVELLTMAGAPESGELALIHHSVESASGRIRFFRIAFGAAPSGQAIAAQEMASILAARARDGRIRYLWDEAGPVDRQDARLLLLMVLCAETALPRGGEIRVGRSAAGWTLEAAAEHVVLQRNLWQPLLDGSDLADCEAASIQFALLPEALRQSGRRLSIKAQDRLLVLTI